MNDLAAHKVAESRWRGDLSSSERELVEVCEKLDEVLPALGATYRAAFFLNLYLTNNYGISGQVVVGFVNNGEDNIYRSHAWYVYEGQKTDLAIALLGGKDSAQSGPVVVHGFDLKPGKKTWTYHMVRPTGSILAVQELVPSSEDKDGQRHAEELHAHMSNVAKDRDMMRNYLDQAPDNIDYQTLSDMVREIR